MDAGDVVTIRTNAGTIKTGLQTFVSLLQKRTDIKDSLGLSDNELKSLEDAKEVVGKIYNNVIELL
jgi:ABC-type uncharacterized transport system YnjBCD ATPase subunit